MLSLGFEKKNLQRFKKRVRVHVIWTIFNTGIEFQDFEGSNRVREFGMQSVRTIVNLPSLVGERFGSELLMSVGLVFSSKSRGYV